MVKPEEAEAVSNSSTVADMVALLYKKREALANQIIGIDQAISILLNPHKPTQPTSVPTARPNIKTTVIDLVNECKVEGINAPALITLANKRGIHLNQQSVSSLLSRLKNEGVLTHDGRVYRPAGSS